MTQERGGFEEQSLGRWKGMGSTARAEHTALHQTTQIYNGKWKVEAGVEDKKVLSCFYFPRLDTCV